MRSTDRALATLFRLPMRRGLPLLTGASILCLLPFLDKAFHIDDPLFLWAARNIQTHPSDPYGFSVNWYGVARPMSEITKNPPLTSYYIALVGRFFGWSERTLHIAFLLPSVGVVAGTYLLARRLCTAPVAAGLIALLTPVVVISSTTVMSDTLMLALFVFAVYTWREGFLLRSHARLLLSAILIALAAFTKYFAMTLIPLLLVYSIAARQRLNVAATYLLIPVVLLAAYQRWTYLLYGRGLLTDAAAYATAMRAPSLQYGRNGVIGLAFTGGCVAQVLFLAPWLWSPTASGVGLLLASAMALVVLHARTLGGFALPEAFGRHLGASIQLSLLAIGGVGLLVLTVSSVVRRRDADALLLSLWVLGTFVFATFLNWTINGRSVLPIVPAAAIVLVQRLDAREWWRAQRHVGSLAISLLAAGGFALLVASADYRLAGAARDAASIIREKYVRPTGSTWFEGHWGFQYYMERIGARALDIERSRPKRGDIIVVPLKNTNTFPLPREWATAVEMIQIQGSSWVATIEPALGAGFYSDLWGPLPFAFGAVPPERYEVFYVSP